MYEAGTNPNMDWEAPVDAWYVWLGAAVISAGLAGFALALPTTPPPDAAQAANTIDRVAGNDLGGTARYEHDARMARIGAEQISLRNDAGTQHATVSFGRLTPVYEHESLEEVLYGAHPTDEYGGSDDDAWRDFHADVQEAQALTLDPEWRTADGTLRVRAITYDHPDESGRKRAILVDV